MNRARAVTVLAPLVVVAAAGVLFAGPLNPPVGPIAPTPGPEPRIAINATNTPGDSDATPSLFKITQPGSYYLTGNIAGVAGRHGIEIAASGVTLDLNGFDLVGLPGMGFFDGVVATVDNSTDICIRNGSVRNWGDDGIDLGSAAAINSRVTDVRASGNVDIGIDVDVNGTVTGCSASANGGLGIRVGNGCTITACSTFSNVGPGIGTGAGSTITGCSANANGSIGIVTSGGCTITQCTARANGGDGIRVSSGCVVLANTCANNGTGDGAGIRATGNDNRIEGNNCTLADRGIDVDAGGNIIIRNTCSGNTVNWDIVAGNAYGPIVQTPVGAAVSGNTAAAFLGSTDPNANFTY